MGRHADTQPAEGTSTPSATATFPGAPTTGATVSTRGLVKTFRGGLDTALTAVDRVDLHIQAGSFVALTGPSGSGKSTLLHLIGAIESPDSGDIEVGGELITDLPRKRLPAYRRSVGFVFQRYNLLPALTALDNVLAPVLPIRTTFDAPARAAELLDAVGLAGRHRGLPSQLSGGQQQRVAIARALINAPRLLLADEPTGNLDTHTGAEILDLIQTIQQQHGMTVLLATHDHAIAENAHRHLSLIDGQILADTQTSPLPIPS